MLLSQMWVSWPARNDVNGIDGLLAMAHGARGVGGVTLWNPATKTVTHSLTGAGGWLRGISWSPDGQWLAIGGEDGIVRIQEVETAEVAVTLGTDSKPVWSVAWSPDGRRLAAGNTGSEGPPRLGGTITVWETPVRVLAGERAIARARSFEITLIDRRVATPAASKPAHVATVFTADGAYDRRHPPARDQINHATRLTGEPSHPRSTLRGPPIASSSERQRALNPGWRNSDVRPR
jgi:dipeptidyl aminopeptidase/acylaminoacyl peptidase